jgi:hypothetical protein
MSFLRALKFAYVGKTQFGTLRENIIQEHFRAHSTPSCKNTHSETGLKPADNDRTAKGTHRHREKLKGPGLT